MSDSESTASSASIPYPDWDPTPPRPERSTRQREPSPEVTIIQPPAGPRTPPAKGKKRAAQTPLRKDKGKKPRATNCGEEKTEQASSKATNKNKATQNGSKSAPSTSKGKVLAGQPTLHAFVAMTRTLTDGVELSKEQKAVLGEIALKKCVFLTGAAGTGKSVLLRAAIRQLGMTYQHRCGAVAVTATTGIAASLLPGVTLHSWAGISNGKDTQTKLVKQIRKNSNALFRWESAMALVIDEVSMLDPHLFDKLDRIGRELRGNDSTFGGIQLVLAGDFYQLPPVIERGEISRHLFEANAWAGINISAQLTTVYRQADPEFCRILNEVRIGEIGIDTDYRLTHGLLQKKATPGPITPVHLFCTRAEVDAMNRDALAKLPGSMHDYLSVDGGTAETSRRTSLLEQLMAVPQVDLKVGAQVMLIKNMRDGLVNGTMGVVKSFATQLEWSRQDGEALPSQRGLSEVQYPVIEFRCIEPDQTTSPVIRLVTPQVFKCETIGPEGKSIIEASRVQLPLILGWAITVHKAQGQGITHLVVNLAKAFQPGQVYVALSRATSLQYLQLIGYNQKKVKVDSKVLRFMRRASWMRV